MDDHIADVRDVSVAIVTDIRVDEVNRPFTARPPELHMKYVESVTLSCLDLISDEANSTDQIGDSVQVCSTETVFPENSCQDDEHVVLVENSVHCCHHDNEDEYHDVIDNIFQDHVRNSHEDVASTTDRLIVLDSGNDDVSLCLVCDDQRVENDLPNVDGSLGVESSDDSFHLDLGEDVRGSHAEFSQDCVEVVSTYNEEYSKAPLLPKQLSVLDVVYESENSENEHDGDVTSDRRRHSMSNSDGLVNESSMTQSAVTKLVDSCHSVQDDIVETLSHSERKPPVGRQVSMSIAAAERSPDYVIVQGQKVELRPQKPPSVSTKRVNSFRKSLIK